MEQKNLHLPSNLPPMKSNYAIEKEFIQNEHLFQDAFFKRFKLRHAATPLQLTDAIAKNYQFPTFYGNVTCEMAIFFCIYERALAMMPHPTMKPIKGTLGRALVAFSCYEYKNVLNIPGYNEIAMTIPVMVDGAFNPPLLPLVMKSFTKAGYYVFSMPVTSHENQLRGLKIWGLPKVTEEIDVQINDNYCTTIAKDEQGKNYFELKVPTTGKLQRLDETGYLYSVLEGKRLKSQTNFQGDFFINKHMNLIWQKNKKSDTIWLKLGDSPRATALKLLQIEEAPFQFRFCKSMNSCFDMAMERV